MLPAAAVNATLVPTPTDWFSGCVVNTGTAASALKKYSDPPTADTSRGPSAATMRLPSRDSHIMWFNWPAQSASLKPPCTGLRNTGRPLRSDTLTVQPRA